MPPLKDPQEEVFAREYVKHGNATRAVVAAGYKVKNWLKDKSCSAGVKASGLLKNDKIRLRVQELTEIRARQSDVSIEYVLAKLKTVVMRSLGEVKPIIDPITKKPTGEYQYDSKGVVSASKLIGEYLGMWSDKLLPPGGDTYNTQVNIYVADNRRVELANGQRSNGSAGTGSPNGQISGPTDAIALPVNGRV